MKKLSNIIESYAAITNISGYEIKEYAKAAIRDIFIQMPTRTVGKSNWPGFENYIKEFFGEDSYNTAMKELFSEGWLTETEHVYQWKKYYAPVPQKQNLKEWADEIKLKNKTIDYLEEDSYAFGYSPFDNEIVISDSAQSHMAIHIDRYICNGRIWTEHKIISFWIYPENLSKLKEVVEDINEYIENYFEEDEKVKINSSWKMEIPKFKDFKININTLSVDLSDLEHLLSDKIRGNPYEAIDSELIPIFDYHPDMIKKSKDFEEKKELRYKLHTMTPTDKEKSGIKIHSPGMGSEKRYKDDVPPTLKYQSKYTSENKISEWADSILTDKIDLTHKSEGAYPFIIIDKKRVYFGKHKSVHADMPSQIPDQKDRHKSMYIAKSNHGRMWTKQKILSFWNLPKTKSELMNTINLINGSIIKSGKKFPLIDSTWRVDVPNVAYDLEKNPELLNVYKDFREYDENDGYYRDIDSILIPIKFWNSKILKDPSEYADKFDDRRELHMMSPLEKEKKGVKIHVPGFGSEKRFDNDIPPTIKHQSKYTSDSMIRLKNLIYESPDKINNLKWDVDESIAFGYLGGEILISGFGQKHADIEFGIHRYNYDYPGRIWVESKLLSFWKYPETNQKMKKIADDLTNAIKKYTHIKNINVWNDFKVEVLIDADKNDITNDWIIGYNLNPVLNDDTYIDIIPVKDFKSSKKRSSKDLAALHVMSPLEKHKKGIKKYSPGFGSEKRFKLDKSYRDKIGNAFNLDDIPPFIKHQLKYTSENIIEEWADFVKLKNNKTLYHTDSDAIPFIYNTTNEFVKIGKLGKSHNSIKGTSFRSPNILNGRLWIDNKIITFWQYPTSKMELYKICNRLNKIFKNEFEDNIKIDSSWKIEMPLTATNYFNYKNPIEWLDAMNIEDVKDIDSVLVQINKWNPSMLRDPSEYSDEFEKRKELHTMSPSEKEKSGVKTQAPGFGSEKRFKDGVPPSINHQSKYTSENTLEPSDVRNKYGCLMLKIEMPNWEKFTNSFVDKEDVYLINSENYGYETEPHVTILFGFTDTTDINKIKRILSQLKNKITIIINNIDIFSTPEFDVVKFNVESKMLRKLNKIFIDNFEYVNSHKEYSPHMTIAYVKKGMGKKYIKKLNKSIILSSNMFKYSYPDGKFEYFSI